MMSTDDDRQRALHALAAALRGQGYRVTVFHWYLVAESHEGRSAEVWVQGRASDNGRLWFTGPGGTPICEAEQTTNAVVAVKGVLHRR
ncbi:hypothetical protein [Thermomonospora amylolytica]|uniref:hypothetical protein n=1 Tax=Thermomonospora amylolytica TaxID=1411117 RepID=UPI000E6CD209|nr:hypothetical protein [Thermomonospora amylolytica]